MKKLTISIDDLFARIGRLTVENEMLNEQVARLQQQLDVYQQNLQQIQQAQQMTAQDEMKKAA